MQKGAPMFNQYAKILFIVFIALSLTTCKKGDGSDSVDDTAVYEVFQVLNTTKTKFLENAGANNGDPKIAIALTGDWLLAQPGVRAVDYEDSTSIYIEMESGMVTRFNFVETDAQGTSKYRGGGGGGTLAPFKSGGSCTNKIENKKVLIYAAAYNDFYRFKPAALQRIVDVFEDADDDFEVTVLKDRQCTIEALEGMGSYGLVLLETHGFQESFLSGVKLTVSEPDLITDIDEFNILISQQLGARYVKLIKEGKVLLFGHVKGDPADPDWWNGGAGGNVLEQDYQLWISSNFLSTFPKMTETVIFGNMCYSGQGARNTCRNTSIISLDKPIKEAFMDLLPISYYCYAFSNQTSLAVQNEDAQAMAYELVTNLVDDGDTTGNAHLSDVGTFYEMSILPHEQARCGSAFNFLHFGSNDYCYGNCGVKLVDPRDNQEYETVCIGNQIWMAENLNFATDDGLCYNQVPANCASYGKLYTINDLTNNATSDLNPSQIGGICPNGWHVPSKAEWEELFAFCGGIGQAYTKLYSSIGWGGAYADEFGYNLKPGGFFGQGFMGLGSNAKVWSCTWDPANSRYVAVDFNGGSIAFVGYAGAPTQDYLLSCRCVKD